MDERCAKWLNIFGLGCNGMNSGQNKTMLRLSQHRFILVSTSHDWKRMLPTGASLQFWDYSVLTGESVYNYRTLIK